MEITIKGTPKEMADLVNKLRSQPGKVTCEANIDGRAVAQATRDNIAKALEQCQSSCHLRSRRNPTNRHG